MICPECKHPLTHEDHTTHWDEGDGDTLFPMSQYTCPKCYRRIYDYADEYEWLSDEHYPRSYAETDDKGKPRQ